jgi:asparagine synthetase B (glutamine-hydrolysing)
VSSINAAGYVSGINFLSKHNFYQNTYAPTLAFAINSVKTHDFSCLITGSGPDELFYGME